MTVYYLDLVGEICPHPLHMTQRQLDVMHYGDTLVVESDFDRSVRNILAWVDKAGCAYQVEESTPGVWRISIIKSADFQFSRGNDETDKTLGHAREV